MEIPDIPARVVLIISGRISAGFMNGTQIKF